MGDKKLDIPPPPPPCYCETESDDSWGWIVVLLGIFMICDVAVFISGSDSFLWKHDPSELELLRLQVEEKKLAIQLLKQDGN